MTSSNSPDACSSVRQHDEPSGHGTSHRILRLPLWEGERALRDRGNDSLHFGGELEAETRALGSLVELVEGIDDVDADR